MGIFDKFQDPESSKAITEELKSKVGITSDESNEVDLDDNTTEQTRSGKQLIVDQVEQVTTGAGSEEPKGKKAAKEKVKEPTTEINQKPIKRKEPKEEQEALSQNEQLELVSMSDAEFEAIINNFKEGYKKSDKENRMIRLQKKNFKHLIKLKLDKVSISEFVNFAIFCTLKSSRYSEIVKTLKPPK